MQSRTGRSSQPQSRTQLLKDAITRRDNMADNKISRGKANYFVYLDSMQRSLNETINDVVKPYWRHHPSLKGWSGMNYPITRQNPTLDRYRPVEEDKPEIKFSNMERPQSCQGRRVMRPFSANIQAGLRFRETKDMEPRLPWEPKNDPCKEKNSMKLTDAINALQPTMQISVGQENDLPEDQQALQPAIINQAMNEMPNPINILNDDLEEEVDEIKALYQKQSKTSRSLSAAQFGRTIGNTAFDDGARSAISSVSRMVSAMPAPKVKKKKKKKKKAATDPDPDDPDADPAAGGDGGDSPAKKKKKKKKKKKAKKSDLPDFPPMQRGPDLTCEQAVQQAVGWRQNHIVSQKLSFGMLSTASYEERATVFNKMNPMTERAAIRPQSQYLGKVPVTTKDRFDRRVVPTLDSIEFDKDADKAEIDYDDPEELLNLRRMRHTVLDEENLGKILNDETECLDLEAKYWIGADFIEKIGKMAPNLKELSLRRMSHLINPTFADIFLVLKEMEAVDLCDCTGLQTSALHLMMRQNSATLIKLQLSGLSHALDDTSVRLLSNMKNLTFLDISYAKRVTDQGLVHFSDKKLPLETLIINGLSSISIAGLSAMLNCCTNSLLDLEAAFLDQDIMKGEFFEKVSICWQLETLDISGCLKINDACFIMLGKGEIIHQPPTPEQPPSDDPKKPVIQMEPPAPIVHHPGLKKLHTVKMGGLPITDFALMNLVKVAPNVQHLDLAGCEGVTDYGIKQVFEKMPDLKYLDLSQMKFVNYAFLEETRQKKPDLLLKKFANPDWDKKDNGLRIPRRVVSKKKKKKKGKKKK